MTLFIQCISQTVHFVVGKISVSGAVSPQGRIVSLKSNSSVLDNLRFLHMSVGLSSSDAGVERIGLDFGELEAGILKVFLIL